MHKEVMEYPRHASNTPAEVESKIDAITHFPLTSPHYASGLYCVYANLTEHRREWLIQSVVIPQLERAFRTPEPETLSRVRDMTAALRGLEAIVQRDFNYTLTPSTHRETFNAYGTEYWGVVQSAVEEGLLKRSSETEPFAHMGQNLADVPFSLAFWRCRHALRAVSTGELDPIVWNGPHIHTLIDNHLTDSAKEQLVQVSRTDDGREMLADAIARRIAQQVVRTSITSHYSALSSRWLFTIQLVPMHILFNQPYHGTDESQPTSFPVQEFYLHCQRMPLDEGKEWHKDKNKKKAINRMSFRYIIGVDKTILKHQIRLAKTPIHTLPYEVIQVVYGYIYGPHSFPSCFFSRFFTPTKGTCPDH